MPQITDSTRFTNAEWEDGVLTLAFKDGKQYEYYDVTFDKYNEFLSSDSKGKFFDANIRKQHEWAKV